MNVKILSLFLLIIVPSIGFPFFCPTNFNQIDLGDSTAKVLQQCGKPTTETTRKEEKNKPQEWNYFIPQNSFTVGNISPVKSSYKTSFAFDANGKIINISVNGIGVSQTQMCNRTIKMGDSKDSVQTACGKPSYINKQSNDSGQQSDENEIKEWSYQSTPPATLVFVNDQLTERK